jgi:hypothetical protein
VRLTNVHVSPMPLAFTVYVLHGRHVVAVRHGQVAQFNDVWGPMTATWRT